MHYFEGGGGDFYLRFGAKLQEDKYDFRNLTASL